MENKMQTLDLFTATAANANLFNEENKVQKAHTRSTLGSTIKMNVMQAMKTIERQFGKCFFEMVDEDEKSIDIIFRDINNRYREFYTCNRQTYVIYNIK
jgi:formylmethanofuran dehydrogenase subunit A